MYVNKILFLALFSVAFNQELKLEGNLRVNGIFINTKVDNLEFVIDSLQTQINTQQTLIEQQSLMGIFSQSDTSKTKPTSLIP